MKRVPEWLRAVLLAALAGLLGAWASAWFDQGARRPAVSALGVEAETLELKTRERQFALRTRTEKPKSVVRVAVATPSGRPEIAQLKVIEVAGAGSGREARLALTQQIPLEGAVELTLPPGEYIFQADGASGHAERRFEVVDAHEHDLWLMLRGVRQVLLKVVAPDGAPVRNAVALSALEEGVKADPLKKYDANGLGDIVVSDAAAGTVGFTVSAPGFAEQFTEIDEQVRSLQVVLTPTYTVEGRVIDDERLAVAGATVSCDGSAAVTDATGGFRLQAFSEALSLVVIDKAGRSLASNLKNPDRKSLTGIELVLKAPHHVFGRVEDELHQPVAGAEVEASELDTQGHPLRLATATTDERGVFNLDGLPAQVPRLTASLGRGSIGEVQNPNLDGAEPIVITLSSNSVAIGVLRDESGIAVAYGTVRLVVERGRLVTAETVTDDSGAYRIADLPTGWATVTALGPDNTRSDSVRVHLQGGAAIRADLTLHRTGVVQGSITGAAGRPVVVSLGRGDEWFMTDAVGDQYEIRVPAGAYSIGASLDREQMEAPGQVEVSANQTTVMNLEVNTDEESPAADRSVMPGDIGAAFEDVNGRVLLTFVISGGPAARAGLVDGDEVLSIGGVEMHSARDAFAAARGKPGTNASLMVRTPSGVKTLSVMRP